MKSRSRGDLECPFCEGTGKVDVLHSNCSARHIIQPESREDCDRCDGRGFFEFTHCDECENELGDDLVIDDIEAVAYCPDCAVEWGLREAS